MTIELNEIANNTATPGGDDRLIIIPEEGLGPAANANAHPLKLARLRDIVSALMLEAKKTLSAVAYVWATAETAPTAPTIPASLVATGGTGLTAAPNGWALNRPSSVSDPDKLWAAEIYLFDDATAVVAPPIEVSGDAPAMSGGGGLTQTQVDARIAALVGAWGLTTAANRTITDMDGVADAATGWYRVQIENLAADAALGLPAEAGGLSGLLFVWGTNTDRRQFFYSPTGAAYYRDNPLAETGFRQVSSPALEALQTRVQALLNRVDLLAERADNFDAAGTVLVDFLASIAHQVVLPPAFAPGWSGAMFDVIAETPDPDDPEGSPPAQAQWSADATVASNSAPVTRTRRGSTIPAESELSADEENDAAPADFARQPATRGEFQPSGLNAALGSPLPARRLFGFGLAFAPDGGAWERLTGDGVFGEGYTLLAYRDGGVVKPLLRADSAGNFIQVISHVGDTVVNRIPTSLVAYGHPGITRLSSDESNGRMVWSVHDNIAEGQPLVLHIVSTHVSTVTGQPYTSQAVVNITQLSFADRDAAENNTGAFYDIPLHPDNSQHPHVRGRFKYVPNASAYGGRDIVVFDFDRDESMAFAAYVSGQAGTIVPEHDAYVSTHVHLDAAGGKHGLFAEIYTNPNDQSANTVMRFSYNGKAVGSHDLERRLEGDELGLVFGDMRAEWWLYNGFFGARTSRLSDDDLRAASRRQSTSAPLMLVPTRHYERLNFAEDELSVGGAGIRDYVAQKIADADALPATTGADEGKVVGIGPDGVLRVQEAARQIGVQYGDNLLDGSSGERQPLTGTGSNTEAEILDVPSESLSNTRLDLGSDGRRVLLIFQEGNSANLFEWEIILPHSAHEFSTPHEDYRVMIGARQSNGIRAVQLRHRRGGSWTLQQIKPQVVGASAAAGAPSPNDGLGDVTHEVEVPHTDFNDEIGGRAWRHDVNTTHNGGRGQPAFIPLEAESIVGLGMVRDIYQLSGSSTSGGARALVRPRDIVIPPGVSRMRVSGRFSYAENVTSGNSGQTAHVIRLFLMRVDDWDDLGGEGVVDLSGSMSETYVITDVADATFVRISTSAASSPGITFGGTFVWGGKWLDVTPGQRFCLAVRSFNTGLIATRTGYEDPGFTPATFAENFNRIRVHFINS